MDKFMKIIYILVILYMLDKDELVNHIHSSSTWKKQPLVIGHKGSSTIAPENTFAAFDRAVKQGVDYLEMDIRPTRDGNFVSFHDPFLDRTTNGTGSVARKTVQELKRLDAGSWFHPSFAEEKIPTIEEVISRYGSKTGLLLDLKTSQHDIEKHFAQKIKQATRNLPQANIIIQSVEPRSISNLKRFLPGTPMCLIITPYTREDIMYTIDDSVKKVDYVNIFHSLITPELIDELHRQKKQVFAWPIQYKSAIQSLYQSSIDGIVTDNPKLV